MGERPHGPSVSQAPRVQTSRFPQYKIVPQGETHLLRTSASSGSRAPMDRALRARQALRFIESPHVSKTDESYTVIHGDDPGLYRLRALAGSSTEQPDEEEWPDSWQNTKGTFQRWVKVSLTKWVGEISHELQQRAEALKKDEVATTATTATQQDTDTTETPVENKDASAQSLAASPEAQRQASEPRDATGTSPSIEDLRLDSGHGHGHGDKTDTLPAPQTEKNQALGDSLGISSGDLTSQLGHNIQVTKPNDTIHELMYSEPPRPELAPSRIGANTPTPPSLTGHGQSAVRNSPRRETRSNVGRDQQQQPSTSTFFDNAPPFSQAPTAKTHAQSTPTFPGTEDSGSGGDTWAWRSNTIPAVRNLLSGNPFATRTPTQADDPAQVSAPAPGRARLGGSEDGDKLSMANLSIREASAPERKKEKPPKEWYEWYKRYHANQRDSI